jgi:redox-sensitive bicupin YhaK (pirin superfamily)
LPSDGELALFDEAKERAIYVVSGRVAVGDTVCAEGTLAVLREGATAVLQAETQSRVIVVGGAPLGPRHIWWNFVSSSEARIERAKRDWAEMRMGSVPGDDEFIPLPDR